MNDNGKFKIVDAIRDELAYSIIPNDTWTEPSRQHEVVEIFARDKHRGNATATTVSALARAGLLYVSDLRSIELAGSDTPQLQLIHEFEDNHLAIGDKRLVFIDKTVVPF